MSLGIPYMGSKRKLAKPIIEHIIENNPNAKYFYDLFGGGGSVSFEALKTGKFKKVFYNEIDESIVNLLKKIRKDGIAKEFYKWIDRDTFHKYKTGKCWKSGLIKTCWSFGNNGRSYLFGSKNEENKRILHEIIVNKCSVSRNDFFDKTGLFVGDEFLKEKTVNKRRLEVMKLVKSSIGRNDMEQLERLQQLEQLERLELSSFSYENVEINTPIEETIIYLDPPYSGTAKYNNDICHDKLLEWVKNSKYKIYISSYDFDLPCVLKMNHRSTLSATANNKVIEKLFCKR